MQQQILILVCLLVMAPVVTGITCYYCVGCSSLSSTSTQDLGYSHCYSYQWLGTWYRGGASSSTACQTVISAYSGTCCSTSYCNGAATKGVSLLLASVAGLLALFRVM